MANKTTQELTRKRVKPSIALLEILELFKKHNIDRSRFHLNQYPSKPKAKGYTILVVDWSDTKEVNGETKANGSGCIIYEFESYKTAADIQQKVLESEPQVGSTVKFKIGPEVQTFGPYPSISLEGVEAVVYHRDDAIPTTRGLKLLIKRAEMRKGFNPTWLVLLKQDLTRPENERMTRLPARTHLCEVIKQEKPSISNIASKILGHKLTPSNAIEHKRIQNILQKEIKRLAK